MIANSENNASCFQTVEEACFSLTLADCSYENTPDYLHAALMGESDMQWADKSVNIIACKDGRMLVQAEHSNVDAIVVMHVGDDAALRSRRTMWQPKDVPFDVPELLAFDVNYEDLNAIDESKKKFSTLKSSFRVKSIIFSGYGNELVRRCKLYMDTVLQIALQLAFFKTHGSFAPIYETASTRKFFHGRTETVRGRTQEMVDFGHAVIAGAETEEQKRLFMAAYEVHNKLMDDATNGNGIDRHFYGLRKTLEMHQKGCSPKINAPAIFTDEAWKLSGGDGNFLLSTSFVGYMGENDEVGGYGYVTAMRPDGYGAFYRIGRNRLQVTITDWTGTKSDLNAFGENITWSLTKLASLFTFNANI